MQRIYTFLVPYDDDKDDVLDDDDRLAEHTVDENDILVQGYFATDYTRVIKTYTDDRNGLIEFYNDVLLYSKKDSLLLPTTNFNADENYISLHSVNKLLNSILILEFTDFLIPKINCVNPSIGSTIHNVVNSLPDELKMVSCIAIGKYSYGLNIDNIDLVDSHAFNGYLLFWLDTYVTNDIIERYLINLNFDKTLDYCKNLKISPCRNIPKYCISPYVSKSNYSVDLSTNQFDTEEDRVLYIGKNQMFASIKSCIDKVNTYKLNNPILRQKTNLQLATNIQETLPEAQTLSCFEDFTILKDRQEYIYKVFSRNPMLFDNRFRLNCITNARPFKLKYIKEVEDFSLFAVASSNHAKYCAFRYDPYYLFPIDTGYAYIFDEVDRETYEFHLYSRLMSSPNNVPSFLSSVSQIRNSLSDKCNDKLLEKMTNTSATEVFEPVSYICSTNGGLILGLQSRRFKRLFVLDRVGENKTRSVVAWYRQMRRFYSSTDKLLLRLKTIFNPSLESGINYETHICNTFHSTAYMLLKPTQFKKKLSTDEMYRLIASKCPYINFLIRNVTGGYPEVKVFHAWLAKILQEKAKTKIAWVLQGIQGTGKGLLADLILRIIFGEYFIKSGMSMFDDKFDSWKDNAFVVFVDEYDRHGHDKKQLSNSRIKELITEEYVSSRKMFSAYKEIRSYSNYIFATNVSDAVRIESSDRRFNVGVWQNVKLDDAYGVTFSADFKYDVFKETILGELEAYVKLLKAFDYSSLLNKALANKSKKIMSNLSETVEQSFIRMLLGGDFVGISNLFSYSDKRTSLPAAHVSYATWVLCIQELHKKKKYTYRSDSSAKSINPILCFNMPIFKSEIFDIYSAFSAKSCLKKLTSVLSYAFPEPKRFSRTLFKSDQRKHGYLHKFYLSMTDLEYLLIDNILLANKVDELRNAANFFVKEKK